MRGSDEGFVGTVRAGTKALEGVSQQSTRTNRRLGRTRSAYRGASSGAAQFAKSTRIAAAALTAAAAGVVLFARQQSELARELRNSSDQLNLGVSTIQAYARAFREFGADRDTTIDGLKTLGERIAEGAEGTGEAVEAFGALGVQFADTSGRIREILPVLHDVADAISALPSQAQRIQLASILFGDEAGLRFLNALQRGSEGLKELVGDAREAGVISESIVNTNVRVGLAFDSLGDRAGAAGQALLALGSPAIIAGIEALETAIGAAASTAAFLAEATQGIEGTYRGRYLADVEKAATDEARLAVVREHLADVTESLAALDVGPALQLDIEPQVSGRPVSGLGALDDQVGRFLRNVVIGTRAVNVPIEVAQDSPGGQRYRQRIREQLEQFAADLERESGDIRARIGITDFVGPLQTPSIQGIEMAAEAASAAIGRSTAEATSEFLALYEEAIGETADLRLRRDREIANQEFDLIIRNTRLRRDAEAQGDRFRQDAVSAILATEFGIDEVRRGSLDVIDAHVRALGDQAVRQGVIGDELTRQDRIAESIGQSLSFGIQSAILEARTLSDVFTGIAKTIAGSLLQEFLLAPLTGGLSSLFRGGGFGRGFLGRQFGGPVSAGLPYLVGETGPELFVPQSAGTVLPDARGFGGLTINAPVSVQSTDAGVFAIVEQAHLAQIQRIRQVVQADVARSHRRPSAYR